MAHAVAVTRQRQLTPIEGEEETLARDGPRSSRHASEERRILGTPLKHGESSTCDGPHEDSENEQLQAAGRAHRGRIRSTSSSDSAHRGRAAVQRGWPLDAASSYPHDAASCTAALNR